MIVALTSASLDITLGVAWWTIKQLFSGAVYLGTYLMSESSATKKNKILGDDPNFVPHAFEMVELEIIHSHTTLSKSHQATYDDDHDFMKIDKTESILTNKQKYFKIPLKEIITRKNKLPLWIVPFLNTYPLTNYSMVKTEKNNSAITQTDSPIFSPFTLINHLEINNHDTDELTVYLKQEDVESSIFQLYQCIKQI